MQIQVGHRDFERAAVEAQSKRQILWLEGCPLLGRLAGKGHGPFNTAGVVATDDAVIAVTLINGAVEVKAY